MIQEALNYIIPSDNREQQLFSANLLTCAYYIIPSDNREQQPAPVKAQVADHYTIPSDY